VDDAEVVKIDTRTERTPRPAAFSSWHPDGDIMAFSFNKVRQFFHTRRDEIRDGYDLDSDLALYLFDEQRVTSTAQITAPDRLETYPCWSADGRYLYFSSAPKLWPDGAELPPAGWQDCLYDLVRIAYDAETGRWGELETVLSAERVGKSITQPRADPQGRFIVVCMSDYSTFPTFQRSADLHLLDLESGEQRRLECNSDRSESWHSWSSNGRWLAFTSKRGDGLFARVYLSHIDEDGHAGVPFAIPQEDPAYHTHNIDVCQLPELITGPVPVRGEALAGVLRSDEWVRGELPVTGASPWPAGLSGGPGLTD
jgi:dipeptidyl aminopeptidase/acylaminoacyl peptidase